MQRPLFPAMAIAAAVGLAFLTPPAAHAASAASAADTKSTVTTKHACAKALEPDGPVCYALIRTDVAPVSAKALKPDATPSGYGPSDLRSAYNLASAASADGSGATVALMEAADDPNLESDLGVYRAQYALPSCTTANSCFRKVNGSGQQGNYPPGDTGWGGEASLDVEMVSAICPNCHILVVESTDLEGAQNVAVSLGAHFISNSWGTNDGSGDSGADADFNHSGVVDVASSGDSGYGVSFPASSRYVVAAGGTSLSRNSSTSRGWSETTWSGAGAGCSSWESKPSWQTDSGCSRRTVADVSAVADPGTGVAFYDSYGQGGWGVVGGTSVSSPIIASVFALAGAPSSAAASVLYAHSGSLNDITSGSDGSCSPSYLCTAGSGYDGPTGLGTPTGSARSTAPVPVAPAAPPARSSRASPRACAWTTATRAPRPEPPCRSGAATAPAPRAGRSSPTARSRSSAAASTSPRAAPRLARRCSTGPATAPEPSSGRRARTARWSTPNPDSALMTQAPAPRREPSCRSGPATAPAPSTGRSRRFRVRAPARP